MIERNFSQINAEYFIWDFTSFTLDILEEECAKVNRDGQDQQFHLNQRVSSKTINYQVSIVIYLYLQLVQSNCMETSLFTTQINNITYCMELERVFTCFAMCLTFHYVLLKNCLGAMAPSMN